MLARKFGRPAAGSMDGRVPWQHNILAKMYVGGPMTATSLHLNK